MSFLRFPLLAVLPLLSLSGLLGDVASGTAVVLVALSLIALAVELLANTGGPRKRPSVLFFALLCVLLYAAQAGALLLPHFARVAAEHAQAAADAGAGQAQGQAPLPGVGSVGTLARKRTLLARGKDLPPLPEKAEVIVPAPPAPSITALPTVVPVAQSPTFGGVLASGTLGREMRTISLVFPCAEERENALNTVDRFCMRTPQDQLAEIIVVDDGSNPPMTQLFAQDARRLDANPRCKLKILRHEITTGLMAAKLTGGKAATGDVVAFFDCHCSPKEGWHTEILNQISANPRRMVVPGITDLDLDTFDEKKDSAVNAKCYLTFDCDFKWFDDDSDFIPTISGGLVAMGREWFNLTGGFDEEMHGWGGENLDQSLRAWLCGGEITRAKSSRIAHMWRTGDPRTGTRYRVRARPTNNRGRVATAWFDAFLPIYRGGRVSEEEVANYREIKRRLGCKPFSYFLYRFRKVYIEGGVIAKEVFHLREKASGRCIARWMGVVRPAECHEGSHDQQLQLGNVDRNTGKCCSGIREYASNDCWDYMDGSGPHWYSCDVTGRNDNQLYYLTSDGHLKRESNNCMYLDVKQEKVLKKPCSDLAEGEGVFERVYTFEPKEYAIYKQELKLHRYDEEFPDLPDN